MLISSNLLLLAFISPSVADVAIDQNQAYSSWMIDSIISREQGLANSGARTGQIEIGIFQSALRQAIEAPATGVHQDPVVYQLSVQRWQDYLNTSVQNSIPSLLNATRDSLYPLDRFSIGNTLLYQRENDNNSSDTAAVQAIQALRTSVDFQTRNYLGGFWYYVYPQWSYNDGMYSLAPWYIHYTMSFEAENTTAAVNDILRQFDLLWEHCYHNDSGLLVHGYDASKTAVWANSITGASPYVWGRSLGWYFTGLVETLELLPTSSAAWRHLQRRFQTLAAAIMKTADPQTGVWWQIVDEGGRSGNYLESSATALFTYSLLKGSRLGFLDRKTTNNTGLSPVEVGIKAYDYMKRAFVVVNVNGTLDWNSTVAICSLNSTASYEVSEVSTWNQALTKY